MIGPKEKIFQIHGFSGNSSLPKNKLFAKKYKIIVSKNYAANEFEDSKTINKCRFCPGIDR